MIASYGYEAVADEHRAQLVLSGPVSDTLKLRLASQYDALDGYYRNDTIAPVGFGGLSPRDRHGPGNESFIIRGTALWQPDTTFDARLKLNYSTDRQSGGVGLQLVSCPDGTGPTGPRNIPFLLGETCRKDRQINLVYPDPTAFRGLIGDSGDLFNKTRQYYGSLELNYRPTTDVTVTSVTGYYNLLFRGQQSASTSTFAGPSIVSVVDPIRRRDFTQELRVASIFPDRSTSWRADFFSAAACSSIRSCRATGRSASLLSSATSKILSRSAQIRCSDSCAGARSAKSSFPPVRGGARRRAISPHGIC